MRLLELYIHIPFCKKKCKYCDFLSGPSTADERESYVKSLCQDIRSYAHLAKACRVISIFVGGGNFTLGDFGRISVGKEILLQIFLSNGSGVCTDFQRCIFENRKARTRMQCLFFVYCEMQHGN